MNRQLAGKKYHSKTRANNQESAMNKKQSACFSKIKQLKENQTHNLKNFLLNRLSQNDFPHQKKPCERVDTIKIQFNFNLKISLDINLPSTMTINELRQLSFSFLKLHKKSCYESNYIYSGLYIENPFKILLKNIQIQDLKKVQRLKSQDKDPYSTNQRQSDCQGCKEQNQNSNYFRCQMKQFVSQLSQILSQFIWQSIILSSKQRKDISSSELTLKQLRFQDNVLYIQQKEDQYELSSKQISPSFNQLFFNPAQKNELLKVFARYQAPFLKSKISTKEKNLLTQTKHKNYLKIPDLNPFKESIFQPYQNEKKKYFSISRYMDDSFKNSKSIFSRQVKKKYTSKIIKQLLSDELDHNYLNQFSGGQSYQDCQNDIKEQDNILKLNQSFHLNRKRLENGQDIQKDIYQMEQNSNTQKNRNKYSFDNFKNQGNENIYIKQHTESSLSMSQSNKEPTSNLQVQSGSKHGNYITFQPAQSYSVNDLDKSYEYLQNLLKKCQVVEWAAASNVLNRNCYNQKQPAQEFNNKAIDLSFCRIPIIIQNQPEIYNLCIFDLKTSNNKSIGNFSSVIRQLFTTINCILDCNLLQLYSFALINNNKKTQQSKKISQKVNSYKGLHDSRKIQCGKVFIKLSNKMNTKLSLVSYISQVLKRKYSDQFIQKEFQSIHHQILILLRQLVNSNIFQTLIKKKNLQRNESKLKSQKNKHHENLWKIFLLNQDKKMKNKYESYPVLSLFCVDLDNFDSYHGTLYLESQQIIKRLKVIFQNLMTHQQKQIFCFINNQNLNFMNNPDELNELTQKKQTKDHHNGENLLQVMMQKVKREFKQVNTIIWQKKSQMRLSKKLIPLNHLFKAHLNQSSNHFIAKCLKTIQINNIPGGKQSFVCKSGKTQVKANSLRILLKFILSQFQKQKQIYHRKIIESSNLLFHQFPTDFLQLMDYYHAQDTREFRAQQDLNIYEKETTYKKKKSSSQSYRNDKNGRNSLILLQDVQTSSFHEYDSLLNLEKKQQVPYQTMNQKQKKKNRRNQLKHFKVQNFITINQKSIPKKKQHK